MVIVILMYQLVTKDKYEKSIIIEVKSEKPIRIVTGKRKCLLVKKVREEERNVNNEETETSLLLCESVNLLKLFVSTSINEVSFIEFIEICTLYLDIKATSFETK